MSQTVIETLSNAANKPSLASDEETASAEQRVPVYKYSHLLPIFDPTERYPPLEAFEHVDPGFRALSHSDPRSFLTNAITEEITPRFGTEVSGVDLLSLGSEGRDQLALEAASRGVLVFRNQVQWLNADPNVWLAFARYFGRPHIHPTSGHPPGYPQIHLVYRDATASFNFEIDQMITSTLWHSDVSYELQPPGLTIFFLLDQRMPFKIQCCDIHYLMAFPLDSKDRRGHTLRLSDCGFTSIFASVCRIPQNIESSSFCS